MAEVQIGHAFVSTKPDSTDASLVSSNEWNAPFLYKNGANGQIPMRDSTQPTGAKWTQGPQAYNASGSAAGGTITGALAAMTIPFTTSCFIIIGVNVLATTSALQVVNLILRRDGVTVRNFSSNGSNVSTVARMDVFGEAAGTHTYDVIASVGSGTITTVAVDTFALVIGA